jgi:hypothetical protein
MTTFISYSRANSDFAVRLAKDLKASGHEVWLDQLDIPTGSRWDDELEKALRTCSTFLIILSPESIKSQNVKDEIGYAIDTGKHILPLMIKQCEVPFRLRRFQYVDFTKDDLDEYKERLRETKALLSNTQELPTASESEKSSAPVKVPVSKPGAKKLLNAPVMYGGGAVIVVALIFVIFMNGRNAPSAAPTETSAPTITVAPTQTAEPQVVVVTSTPAPTSTTAPNTSTPEPQPFYTEEFNGDLSNWSTFVTSGNEDRMKISTDNGKLVFDLNDPNSDLYAYAVLNSFNYTDVKMEATASNRGVNDNNISLICRYTDRGWYEFNIANSGLYWIYAYDSIGAVAKGYNQLYAGGSTAIKGGQDTNTYVATCKGNKLSLSINGVDVRTITENQFRFDQGKIGLSVSSFQVLPVKIEFDSLKISEP